MPLYLLAAWTLFTWGTRIRNAAGDHESVTAYIVPSLLLLVAVAAVVRARRWGPLLVVASTVAWLVRVPAIWSGDWSIAFKVVHTTLAAISWALAAWTVRSGASRGRRPVTTSST
jgi:hypothetical protein